MANIEKRTVQVDKLVVKDKNNIANVDDVINVLTVLTSSEKRLNFFDQPEATNYLKSVGLISEREPNMFAVEDKAGCEALCDELSNCVTDLIAHYATPEKQPAVVFNSANKTENAE